MIFRHLYKVLSRPFRLMRRHRGDSHPQTEPPTATPINPDVRHEEGDVNWRLILKALAIGTVAAIGLLIGLWGLLQIFALNRDEATLTHGQYETPRTVFEHIALTELEMVQQTEESRLQSSGSADKATGRMRIPISRAMERVVQQGLPQWPEHRHGDTENHKHSNNAHPAEHHDHEH